MEQEVKGNTDSDEANVIVFSQVVSRLVKGDSSPNSRLV